MCENFNPIKDKDLVVHSISVCLTMKSLLLVFSIIGMSRSNLFFGWVPLCGNGSDGYTHWYFFSDQKLSWFDASDECNLYGGYLLHIDTLKEQNCLLDYGHIVNIAGWFWQDGE